MPVAPPFQSPVNNAQPATNSLYPALYLYPLNDTWAHKHITLSNQHTKIGRQTSSKTAPGERNGFFDSKVLSRQHAEVWEENGKIFIKDVRSSNGTFINGERLSSESQESEPFELKSDDIVEFGIDIVGEDNKTIIHHKVAARVVCVFNEQDAQVAARAEQHQQQHLQQQQFLQQQATPGAPSPLSTVTSSGSSLIGGAAGSQSFPFAAAAQRRAQLAQQGLGGMGGVRPPGKTGLSFDVILSRLQGELQKSRETGAELNSLTGTMNEINDTLGGNLPTGLPPLPNTLPPVRPPQDPNANASTSSAPASGPVGARTSGAASPDHSQPPVAPGTSGSMQDLQHQLRETQSSLASHKEKVRSLEEVLTEQELLKRDVKSLKEFMEERRRDLESRSVDERMIDDNELVLRGRSFDRDSERGRREEALLHDGFDLEDDDGLHDALDDEDDTRSITTAMPHLLERVDEEDEDHLDSDHEQVDEPESVRPLDDGMLDVAVSGLSSYDSSASGERLNESVGVEEEEEERRREDLNVGRPRTPEPRLGLVPTARRATVSSPLPEPSSDHSNVTDAIFDQVVQLASQLSSVIQVTKTLEAQHHDAQDTIKGLEHKVASLEQMLKAAEDALATRASPKKVEEEEPSPEVEEEKESPSLLEGKQYSSLVDMMAEWKKSVEGQWSSVREEWSDERERLAKAREEYESKLRQVDNGLERVTSMQTSLFSQQQQIQAQFQQQQQQFSALNNSHTLSHSFLHHNGDAVKHYGGLVTPPSPRSQSSDSGRYRRRRRRSSGSRGSGRAGSSSPVRLGKGADEENDDQGVEEYDAALALSTEDDLEGKEGSHRLGEVSSTLEESTSRSVVILHGHQLATPASSVGSLEGDITSLTAKKSKGGVIALSTRSNCEDMTSSGHSIAAPTINVQTAAGVVLLSIAAAAVFWKVKPE